MRYQGEYSPSFLLDPGTQRFHALTPKIDQYLQIHGGYTPFTEIEAMEDKAVKEEYDAVKGAKRDVEMAEPREPRPRRPKGMAFEQTNGGNDNDDSDDSDDDADDDGPTDYPTPPPPGFADPTALGQSALDALLVFMVRSDGAGMVPYGAFRSSLTPVGRRMTRELVAAVGEGMFAKEADEIPTKGLLHFG